MISLFNAVFHSDTRQYIHPVTYCATYVYDSFCLSIAIVSVIFVAQNPTHEEYVSYVYDHGLQRCFLLITGPHRSGGQRAKKINRRRIGTVLKYGEDINFPFNKKWFYIKILLRDKKRIFLI
jgi:hypothetical protein